MVPNLALLPFGAEQVFVVGGCPVHCRRLSSILALHLSGAICSTVGKTENVFRH